ncbi:adenosylmethionine decarboxylase [Roseovarius sp. D22-M7]|uniref:adenosylmethionine decarboxylase n=1 Tax=Roseovarius sp. D22-M7 TaxID=3127116 RepID=UPI00300FAAD2
MTDANLFRLGIGLETGAQEEDINRGIAAGDQSTNTPRNVLDTDRDDHFIRRGDAVFAGTHLIIEVANGHGLDDEARIQQAFRDCVESCGATLVHIHTHKFSPQGVSGVAVLAESHISVHTWPEIGYGAFDVFMCGDARPWRAVDVLKSAFGTADVRVTELKRGEDVVTEAGVAA